MQILQTLWNTLLVRPIFNVLVFFYQLTGDMGISIILLTILVNLIFLPITLKTVKATQKQRDLQPELDKIKKKYKHDKKKQSEAQMELFKQHGINPASGCLTQLPVIIGFFALFSVVRDFTAANLEIINNYIYFDALKFTDPGQLSPHFLVWDLSVPDAYYILPVLTAVLQFLSSKMIMPYVKEGEQAAKNTPDKKDDIAYNMQQQMLYVMPLIFLVIGARLPAGVVLYIVTSTVFRIVQSYFSSGWGGLTLWINRFKSAIGIKPQIKLEKSIEKAMAELDATSDDLSDSSKEEKAQKKPSKKKKKKKGK